MYCDYFYLADVGDGGCEVNDEMLKEQKNKIVKLHKKLNNRRKGKYIILLGLIFFCYYNSCTGEVYWNKQC